MAKKTITIDKEDLVAALEELLKSHDAAVKAADKIATQADQCREEKKKIKAKNEDVRDFCVITTENPGPYTNLVDMGSAFLIQAPIKIDAGDVIEKIRTAMSVYNANKRHKVKTESFGDAFGALPRKLWKEQGLRIRTKEAVEIAVVKNKQ